MSKISQEKPKHYDKYKETVKASVMRNYNKKKQEKIDNGTLKPVGRPKTSETTKKVSTESLLNQIHKNLKILQERNPDVEYNLIIQVSIK